MLFIKKAKESYSYTLYQASDANEIFLDTREVRIWSITQTKGNAIFVGGTEGTVWELNIQTDSTNKLVRISRKHLDEGGLKAVARGLRFRFSQ